MRASTAVNLAFSSPAALESVVILPTFGNAMSRLKEFWKARDLLWLFAARDITVRYKQTAFGAAWAIIQPLSATAVFSLFFGRLANMPSDGVPYPVFSFAGLIAWTYFSHAVTQASGSLVASAGLLRKIYFPRLIIPVAAAITGLVDLAVAMLVLFALMAVYGIAPGPQIVFLPLFILLTMLVALGMGLCFAALNVKYRDVRYVVPFLIQIWLFATPIAYSSSLVPDRWRPLLALNPMVGVVEGVRWAALGTPAPGSGLFISMGVVLALLVLGFFYFGRVERSFADVV